MGAAACGQQALNAEYSMCCADGLMSKLLAGGLNLGLFQGLSRGLLRLDYGRDVDCEPLP